MYPNMLITEAHKIQVLNVETAIAAANYPASGSFIDVAEYPRFGFLIAVGVLDSDLVFQVQQASANNGTPKDVTGAVVNVANTGDSKWYFVEVDASKLDINNDYRFVSLKSTGAAGTNDYGAIIFFGVAGEKPATQGADKGSIVTLVV